MRVVGLLVAICPLTFSFWINVGTVGSDSKLDSLLWGCVIGPLCWLFLPFAFLVCCSFSYITWTCLLIMKHLCWHNMTLAGMRYIYQIWSKLDGSFEFEKRKMRKLVFVRLVVVLGNWVLKVDVISWMIECSPIAGKEFHSASTLCQWSGLRFNHPKRKKMEEEEEKEEGQ